MTIEAIEKERSLFFLKRRKQDEKE